MGENFTSPSSLSLLRCTCEIRNNLFVGDADVISDLLLLLRFGSSLWMNGNGLWFLIRYEKWKQNGVLCNFDLEFVSLCCSWCSSFSL